MMGVERVVVASLLLFSQGVRVAVIAMPGGRPKGYFLCGIFHFYSSIFLHVFRQCSSLL